MSDKINLEALFEGMDKAVLSEDAQKKIESLINETVDVRVAAKEKLLQEELSKVKADLETEKKKISEEAAANEKVLVEQAERFKKSLEEAVIEESTKFKESFTKAKEAEVEEQKKQLQEMVLAEAKSFKEKQDAVLVEEVKNFKAELIEKVSDYLEAKLTEAVPAEIMESATKLAVLEPLVTGIMESFSKNFVKLDTTSYKLIKESRDEIAKLESQIQEKAKLEVNLKKEKRELERNLKVARLTEGLTQVQKEKAVKLLEGVEFEKLEDHYKKIGDIITESKVEAPKAEVEKLQESAKPEAKVEAPKTTIADQEAIKHQVKKVLSESVIKEETGKAPQKGANKTIQTWASKVKPGYIETPK